MSDDDTVIESRRLVVMVPVDLYDQLERRASAGDRPVAAECRRAFRAYLASEERAA